MLRELRNYLTSKHGQVLCEHIFDAQLSTVTLLKSSPVPDNFCFLVCSSVGSLLCLTNQICIWSIKTQGYPDIHKGIQDHFGIIGRAQARVRTEVILHRRAEHNSIAACNACFITGLQSKPKRHSAFCCLCIASPLLQNYHCSWNGVIINGNLLELKHDKMNQHLQFIP